MQHHQSKEDTRSQYSGKVVHQIIIPIHEVRFLSLRHMSESEGIASNIDIQLACDVARQARIQSDSTDVRVSAMSLNVAKCGSFSECTRIAGSGSDRHVPETRADR